MTPALHIGKCSDEVKTTVTPEFHDLIAEKARELRCAPSELVRDALYLAFTGATYSCHVAKDRRSTFGLEGLTLADNTASNGDLK